MSVCDDSNELYHGTLAAAVMHSKHRKTGKIFREPVCVRFHKSICKPSAINHVHKPRLFASFSEACLKVITRLGDMIVRIRIAWKATAVSSID